MVPGVIVDDGADGLASRSLHRDASSGTGYRTTNGSAWSRSPCRSPSLSARELAFHITDNEGYFISESSVYRILKAYDLVTSPAYIVMSAADEFKHKTKKGARAVADRLHLLQDRRLGLVLPVDGAGRLQPVHHQLEPAIVDERRGRAGDAGPGSGRRPVWSRLNVRCRPRLLSRQRSVLRVEGSGRFIWRTRAWTHTRGAPYHPQTQGKIERYHRTMKNVVKLQNYYQKEELERELVGFVDYYNNERVHESLDNVTPADVYHGRRHEILTARQLLKMQTLRRRRCYNQGYELKDEELIRPSLIRECVY